MAQRGIDTNDHLQALAGRGFGGDLAVIRTHLALAAR
jgi:hypothetical protein